MNEFRKSYLESRETLDVEIFERIKNNPKPSINDLWALSEERFIEWRKLNDFPRLLNHFDKVLPHFVLWKEQYKLTNEIIVNSGNISQFIEKKSVKKKKGKKPIYLLNQQWNSKEIIIVSDNKIEGDKEYLGTTFSFIFLEEFQSYLDWLEIQGFSTKILNVTSRISPRTTAERVWINANGHSNASDFELLKMGGIKIPTDGVNILKRGKYIEFANLTGLMLEGEIHFGEEGNLECSYCVCDNWIGVDLDMPMFNIRYSSLLNFDLVNSKLNSWTFYDTVATGNILNTKLQNVKIIGGYFDPLMQASSLYNTHIHNGKNTTNLNLNGFKTFKKIYESQGEDHLAKSYYILENEFIRSKLTGWNFMTKSLSYYYWQYGSKPHRIIYCSIAAIILFSLVYWLNSDLISMNTKEGNFNFGDSIYFSTITFTTLGYGDFSPQGWLKILASLESFLGVINTGFLLAGYANNKY